MQIKSLRVWTRCMGWGVFVLWGLPFLVVGVNSGSNSLFVNLAMGAFFGVFVTYAIRIACPLVVYLLNLEHRIQFVDEQKQFRHAKPRRQKRRPNMSKKQFQKRLAQKRQLAREKARKHLQRDNIRHQCQLIFHKYSSEIADRFNEQQFLQFVAQYLHDGVPVEVLRERGRTLARTIIGLAQKNLNDSAPNSGETTLASIMAEYERAKKEILLLNTSHDVKQTLLTEIAHQKDRSIREYLA